MSPRVVQVSAVRDPRLRTGEEILAAWRGVEMTARAAADAGFDTRVVQAAWRDEELVRDGIRYRFVREREGAMGRVLRRLRPRLATAVRELRPAVVHVQGLGFPHAHQVRGDGAVVLAQDHLDRVPAGWKRTGRRHALRRIDGALFTAAEMALPFVDAGVLRAGIPVYEVLEATSAFTPGDVEEARKRTGLGGDPCILWLGHLDANKDPLTILDAVSRVLLGLPGLRLWMCFGKAPLEPQVRARLAAEPELAARVTLLGRVTHPEVEHLCRAADLLVQGSHREGTSYALLESLACGCTPLVTDIPPLRRMTGGGAVGGLFRPGDAVGLARLLESFGARPRAELRRAARAHFERHLSPAALSRELGAAYEAAARRR
ncbi:MAG TPA: glycosyltransferase family 4 protein [Longimicrobium sp.]|nr:glycosyltransferase family 4 protein [Longimicrobium sp.]